jgi:hypothetical protein
VRKISEGAIGEKNATLRFLINIPIIKINAPSHRIFSRAAKRLDVLVVSRPIIGLKRNVELIYGARQAIQKYVSKLVGGRFTRASPSLGQL